MKRWFSLALLALLSASTAHALTCSGDFATCANGAIAVPNCAANESVKNNGTDTGTACFVAADLSSAQTLTNKTIDGGDSGTDTTRPSGSNILGWRSHDTDCTTITDGKPREVCCDEDDWKCWLCLTGDGTCNIASEWKRIAPMSVKRNNSLQGVGSLIDFGLEFDVTCSAGECDVSAGSTFTLCGNSVGKTCTIDETMYEDENAAISAVHTNTHIPDTYKETGPDPTFWGSGADGAFTLPDVSSGASCGTTPGSGNCPAACTGGCSGTNTPDNSYSCTCKLTPNSHIGAFNSINTYNTPSFLKQFSSLSIASDWTVTIDRTVTAGCLNAAASQLQLYVRGDCTVNGKINLKGLGGCSVAGGTLAANQAGKPGHSTMLGGGAAGTTSSVNGGAGNRTAWFSWAPGQALPFLGGSGGGAAPVSGAGTGADTLWFERPALGSTGGGGGGCPSGASGTVGAGGFGGGGLVVACMGTATFDGATIDLSGNAAGNGSTSGSAGGGGSGNALIIASAVTWNSVTTTCSGGTGGSAVSTCGTGGAGGAGMVITYSLTGGNACHGNCSSY
jgi:hypothetical protein